jgi:HTH-type transcriptional regulator / antitoxin HipB
MDYPVPLASQLRQLLRSLRKARGWTQVDLAQRLGVVQSRVATIERDPGAVSVEQLLHILALLGAQLVVRDGQPAGADLEAHMVARPEMSATLSTGADAPPPPAEPSKGQW